VVKANGVGDEVGTFTAAQRPASQSENRAFQTPIN
jgi:hypothetical protein